MKVYLKMLWFIAILGIVTSGIFVGMEAWTAPLIEANAAIELKSTLLDAYEVLYTTPTVNDVFAAHVTVHQVGDQVLYLDNSGGNVSFEFRGSGVWGPIYGILTLSPDLETIKHIRVLQQEETPGLGGVVAEPRYLAGYVGVKLAPPLALRPAGGGTGNPNEVDAITGATRTSNAFIRILNTSYAEHLDALKEVGK